MRPPPAMRALRLRAEPYLVLLIGAAIFATRIDALTLRGEEPRRALVAYEMTTSGNWFVPTQQGLLFADRPPLGAWLMAASARLCGDWSPTAVRLPTIFAVIATGLAIYAYTRRFLSPFAAVASACIYFTFGQVLQLGRLAECEGLFIALLSTALFGWHAAYADGRRAWRAWFVGYTFAALAGLGKGPQGPVYFVTAVGAYLLLVRRDGRFLFSRAHLCAIAWFAAIFAAWLVPYGAYTDAASVRRILFGLVTTRLGDDGSLARHVATYPFYVAGSLLPWSLLLVRYASKSVRAELGPSRDAALFCAAAVGATFPSVWFAFGAVGRHFMSMYPCFAVLAAIVVERETVSAAKALAASPQRGGSPWSHFAKFMVAAMIGAAVVVGAGAVPAVRARLPADWSARLSQPTPFAVAYVIVVAAATLVVLRAIRRGGGSVVPRTVFAATLFLGLSYTGGVVNALAAVSEDTAATVAAAKANLPRGERLESIGELDPLFLFLYRDRIDVRRPSAAADIPPGGYFALNGPALPALPFAWDRVATVSCERNRKAAPLRTVEIGRRRPGPPVSDHAIRR